MVQYRMRWQHRTLTSHHNLQEVINHQDPIRRRTIVVITVICKEIQEKSKNFAQAECLMV